MFAQTVHATAQLFARHNPLGPAPQEASNALGRIGKYLLEPPVEGFVGKRLRLRIGSYLEQGSMRASTGRS